MILFTYITKVCQNFRAEKANYEIMKIGKDEYFDKWPGVKVKNENSKSKLRRMEWEKGKGALLFSCQMASVNDKSSNKWYRVSQRKVGYFCALPSKRLSEKWKLNSNKRKTALTFCCRLSWLVCWFEFCRSFPERKQGITRCSPELVRPVNEPVSCTFIRKTCDVNKNKNKKENSYLVLEGPSSKKKCTRLLCVYLWK